MTSTTGQKNSGRISTLSGKRAGFTLVELLLVLVIISAVLAISAPSLKGFFASRHTADTAMMMLSLAKYAGSEAVAQGRLWRLNINSSSGEYWLTAQESGAFVTIKSSMGHRFRMPEGASLKVDVKTMPTEPDVSYVQFYPNGRTDVATIDITGKQGDMFRVTCPSATEPFRVVSGSEVR